MRTKNRCEERYMLVVSVYVTPAEVAIRPCLVHPKNKKNKFFVVLNFAAHA